MDIITIVHFSGIDGSNTYWIGATDLFHEGQWTWAHSGFPIGPFIWHVGQPSCDIECNCAYVSSNYFVYETRCVYETAEGWHYPLCQRIE